MFLWLVKEIQENPSLFFILKFCSVLSVLHRIFLQINKIISFARTNKIFSMNIVYITYDSWKGLFKDYLILYFKILSFSSLVIWFFGNPCRLAHLILLFSLLVFSLLLLLFFTASSKKLNLFEGFKLLLFFLIFLTFLSISFCYNLNLFLFIKYSVWLDLVIPVAYLLYDDMPVKGYIYKICAIHRTFFIVVKIIEDDPNFYDGDSFRSLKKNK